MSTPCFCKSRIPFENCCKPFLSGKVIPQTPEQLMRSRYTAYATGDFSYIAATMGEGALNGFSVVEAEAWAKRHRWIGLEVLGASAQGDVGTVTFVATYVSVEGAVGTLEECSRFKRVGGRWVYVGGDLWG